MKRITPDDIIDKDTWEVKYIQLDTFDPFVCQKATAYSISPNPQDPRWEDITYYTDANIKFKSMWKSDETSRVRVDWMENPQIELF
jgi:hypothetical protein